MRELFTEKRIAAFSQKIGGVGLRECWPWLGHHNKDGYGKFSVNEKRVSTITAQRISYALFWGEIPLGLTIDHLCRNRSCVNPYHLRAVTNRQNILAGMSQAAQNARKLFCKRGHPLSGTNLLVVRLNRKFRKNRRTCRACAKIHKDAWDERNR